MNKHEFAWIIFEGGVDFIGEELGCGWQGPKVSPNPFDGPCHTVID
jgi:hypothetical protein